MKVLKADTIQLKFSATSKKNYRSNGEGPDMLHAIVSTAKFADLGIQDIKFEINNIDITQLTDSPNEMDEDT